MISAALTSRFATVLVSLFTAASILADSTSTPTPAAEPGRGLGTATVGGVVSDDSGARIPGVTVSATRAGEAEGGALAVTDTDGGFKITNLRPGEYALEAVLDGFQRISRGVKLGTGQAVNVAFKLVPSFNETVQVVAEATRTGEVAILESRRQSAVVSDSISAEEIRRTPDSSAASVVERLTGVTLIGDKYVFVRGLGERYSGTTINGAALATTESEKRVVPLDLFPARLLETVNVVKTYTPDKPGDFGSGVVEMTTVEFPAGQTLKLSIGASHHSAATGGQFRRYGGGLDWQGRGGQAIPSSIPQDVLRRRNILDPEGFTTEELQVFGRAIASSWTGQEQSSAPAGTDFSLTYGNTFGRFGLVLSAVANHGYTVVDEVQRFYGVDGGVLVPINDYELTADRETASNGYVGNFSIRVNDSNRLFLNGLLTRDASAEDRFQEGLQTGTGGNIRDYRVRYQLEEIFSGRLRGEHNLPGPGIGSLVEWSLARSEATNDSDLRENVYRESSQGVFFIETGYADTGKVEYFNLDDQIEQGALAYSTFFSSNSGAWSGTVKTGYDRFDRTRDFGARRFRFVPGALVNIDPTDLPNEIFTPENIGPNRFEIREVTGVNDAYDAAHVIDAGYLMADVTRNKWRLIAGARYEMSDQRVMTFNPFDVVNPVVALNESNDFLPSINLVYQLEPQTNLRFGYGRSLNRPEFRELSPFAFTEVAGGRSVAGNPDLKQATLDSFDVRWETFPVSGQVIAASAFLKMIDLPIEKIVQPTTDLRQSFVNAESARLWGVELEFRRSLDLVTPLLRHWSLNLNYAYINSDVTIGEQQLSVVTNTDRPLEGQSDQVGNVGLQFFKPEWGTMVRFLGSYNGERLAEVGAFGLPDTYEAANTSLDLVVSQSLGTFARGLELKLGATNLLDDTREFVQGGAIQRAYEQGRKVSLSLSYSPF